MKSSLRTACRSSLSSCSGEMFVIFRGGSGVGVCDKLSSAIDQEFIADLKISGDKA